MSKTGQLANEEHDKVLADIYFEFKAGTLSLRGARDRLIAIGYNNYPENPRNLLEALDALEENT